MQLHLPHANPLRTQSQNGRTKHENSYHWQECKHKQLPERSDEHIYTLTFPRILLGGLPPIDITNGIGKQTH